MLSIRNYLAFLTALTLSTTTYSSDRHVGPSESKKPKYSNQDYEVPSSSEESSDEEDSDDEISRKREREDYDSDQEKDESLNKVLKDNASSLKKLELKLSQLVKSDYSLQSYIADEIQKRWNTLSDWQKNDVALYMANFDTVDIENDETIGMIWFDIFMAMIDANEENRGLLASYDFKLYEEAAQFTSNSGPMHFDVRHYIALVKVLSSFSEKALTTIKNHLEGNIIAYIAKSEAQIDYTILNLITILHEINEIGEDRIDDMFRIINEQHEYFDSDDHAISDKIASLVHALAMIPADRFNVVHEAFYNIFKAHLETPAFLENSDYYESKFIQVVRILLFFSDDNIKLTEQYLMKRNRYDGELDKNAIKNFRCFLTDFISDEKLAVKLLNMLLGDGINSYMLEKILVSLVNNPSLIDHEHFNQLLNEPTELIIKILDSTLNITVKSPDLEAPAFMFLYRNKNDLDDYFVALLTGLPSGKLSAILNLPDDTSRERIDLIKEILPENGDSNEQIKLMGRLVECSDEHLKAIFTLVKSSRGEKLYAENSILETVYKISPDRVQGVVNTILACDPNRTMPFTMYGKLILYVNSFPQEQFDKLSKICVHICSGVNFLPYVLDKLYEVPVDRLEKAVTAADQMVACPPFTDKSQFFVMRYANILLTLGTAVEEDPTYIAQAYQQLPKVNHKWTYEDDERAIFVLSWLPREVMGKFVQIINNGITAGITSDIFTHIMDRLPFLPDELIVTDSFIKGNLLDIVQHMTNHNSDKLNQIFEYWTRILNHEHKKRSNILSKFIVQYANRMGLQEEHELVQQAIRIQTLMDPNNSKSPYVIYQNLKAKKLASINWSELKTLMGRNNDLCYKLNHKKVAELGASLQLDLDSVPKFGPGFFARLLSDLKKHLLQNKPRLDEIAQIMRTQMDVISAELGDDKLANLGKAFLKIIDDHLKPDSHMHTLMNAPATHIEASKLKCVMNHIGHMQTSEMAQRLCQLLAGARNCNIGQDTAIQDYYMNLPTEYRIKSKIGELSLTNSAQLPALSTLYSALQSAVSMQFSAENGFMRGLCKTQEIMQASHQINYVKGLIGDKVGLSEGAKFDINGQVIYPHVLNISLQEMIESYYKHLDLNNFLTLIKGSFDSQIRAQDKDARTALYGSLRAINDSLKTDDLDLWVELNEETYAIEEISPRGVVRVMQHAGLLDPFENN